MKTHRCKESLKKQISIRYTNPYLFSSLSKEENWWLLKSMEDFDYDCFYLQPIAPIQYCPFCGKKLEK